MPTFPQPPFVANHYGVYTFDAIGATTRTQLTSADFKGTDGAALPGDLVLVGYTIDNEDATAANYVYTGGAGYVGAVGNMTRCGGGRSVAVNLRGVGGDTGELGICFEKVAAGSTGQIRAWFDEPEA